MILLLEADKILSKKLCELVDRERIEVIDTERQVLEAIVKHRGEVKVIVVNHRRFSVILAHGLITQVCQKLGIKPMPVIGYHLKGDPEPPAMDRQMPGYRLIDYDDSDPDFPDKFFQALREAYPEINVDLGKAKIVWSARPEDLLDVGKWLEDAGFGEMEKLAQTMGPVVPPANPKPKSPAPARKLPEPVKKPPASTRGPLDYRKMYEDLKKEHEQLKKKHEDLLKQVKDIIDL